MHTVSQAYRALQPDPWRLHEGFSPDIQQVQEEMFEADSTDEIAKLLNGWIIKSPNQPCLFGRQAGTNQQIGYCVLREEDLLKNDSDVAAKILHDRLAFYQKAFEGAQSAFIILAASPRIAEAKPSYALAHAITRLYLEEYDTIEPDAIYIERVRLELPGREKHALEWRAGVNYFSVHGDKRWWHDHRIPGGIALSVNSVGHLVASSKAKKLDDQSAEAFGIEADAPRVMPMRGLEGALVAAMQIIENTGCPYGKATRLYSREELPIQAGMTSPVLPGKLAEKNPCKYAGWYHTDHTLPSVFFTQDVVRPSGISEHELDFTYLFHDAPDNPDFRRMGPGVQIRIVDENPAYISTREHKMVPEVIKIADCPLLCRALDTRAN